METIQTYEQDNSAMERIFAWRFGLDMGLGRFLGGGFGAYSAENYRRYAPEVVEEAVALGIPETLVYQAAHSIYFGVLGEHGVIGLLLFLMLGALTWRSAGRVVREARRRPDLKWAGDLAGMIQVAILGYAVGGAFLSLEYFDLVYHLVAITVLVEGIALAPAVAAPSNVAVAPVAGVKSSLNSVST
jgi:probable O-glycosylation ligase (exosortase A-associated)